MSDPDAVPSRIADNMLEGESPDVVPSRTPISGNGSMPRSDKVIDDTGQAMVRSNVQMMFDDL